MNVYDSVDVGKDVVCAEQLGFTTFLPLAKRIFMLFLSTAQHFRESLSVVLID